MIGKLPEHIKPLVTSLGGVVNLGFKTVAKEFGIATTRVSKIQEAIEGIDQIDPKLLKLLKQYKVKQ